MNALRLSIIMPAYNAAAFLPRSLAAIRRQLPPDAELIVVDDGSTDATAATAGALGARVIRLPENKGSSHARNTGAAAATGDVLVFVDADVILHEAVLFRVRSLFEEHADITAVFGSYDAHPTAVHQSGLYRNLLHHFEHQHGRTDAVTFWTGCGAIRRKAFEEVGGFDAKRFPRYMEDVELGYRLRKAGGVIRLDKSLQCTHLKDWPLFAMIRSDVFHRARPWVRMNLQHHFWPDDLNLKLRGRASVLLVGAAVVFTAAALKIPWSLALAALAIAGMVVINRELFGFLRQARGWGFAALCVLFHTIHLLSGIAGGLLGALDWTFAARARTLTNAGKNAGKKMAAGQGFEP